MKLVDFLARGVVWFLFVSAGMAMLCGCSVGAGAGSSKVLIIMDEREQMEVLAGYMKERGGVESVIVDQDGVAGDLSSYDAVIGYIHKALAEKTELAIIDYTKKGGRYVCIHHSISSKKSANEFYFDFLGVQLDGLEEAKEPTRHGGHYAWRHPVDMTIVNLNPGHYITSRGIDWDERVSYRSSDEPSVEREYPAFTLEETEFYLNHKFTDGREKTVLLGFKCVDDRNGVVFMQDRAAWVKPYGDGHIVYLKMGHGTEEFELPNVAQLVLNAVLWGR